jgi:hypothetical protein
MRSVADALPPACPLSFHHPPPTTSTIIIVCQSLPYRKSRAGVTPLLGNHRCSYATTTTRLHRVPPLRVYPRTCPSAPPRSHAGVGHHHASDFSQIVCIATTLSRHLASKAPPSRRGDQPQHEAVAIPGRFGPAAAAQEDQAIAFPRCTFLLVPAIRLAGRRVANSTPDSQPERS